MRTAQVTSLDGPGAVTVHEVDEPSGGQVVIDVEYAGVTFPDVLLTRGSTRSKPRPRSSLAAGLRVVRSAPEGALVTAGDRVARRSPDSRWLRAGRRRGPTDGFRFACPGEASNGCGTSREPTSPWISTLIVRRGRLQPSARRSSYRAPPVVWGPPPSRWRRRSAPASSVMSDDSRPRWHAEPGPTKPYPPISRAAVGELTGGRGVDWWLIPVGGDRFTDSLRRWPRRDGCW